MDKPLWIAFGVIAYCLVSLIVIALCAKRAPLMDDLGPTNGDEFP